MRHWIARHITHLEADFYVSQGWFVTTHGVRGDHVCCIASFLCTRDSWKQPAAQNFAS